MKRKVWLDSMPRRQQQVAINKLNAKRRSLRSRVNVVLMRAESYLALKYAGIV